MESKERRDLVGRIQELAPAHDSALSDSEALIYARKVLSTLDPNDSTIDKDAVCPSCFIPRPYASKTWLASIIVKQVIADPALLTAVLDAEAKSIALRMDEQVKELLGFLVPMAENAREARAAMFANIESLEAVDGK